jgi:hypothetical protein
MRHEDCNLRAVMDHLLIQTNFPGFNRTVLALRRKDKNHRLRFYYDLYQVGHFLGSIFPALSAQGKLVWASVQQMDQDFVALIGKKILNVEM